MSSSMWGDMHEWNEGSEEQEAEDPVSESLLRLLSPTIFEIRGGLRLVFGFAGLSTVRATLRAEVLTQTL